MNCRFCFKAFVSLNNLGFPIVRRSLDDPTVCTDCYKVGTDMNARMRDQAAAQVDARTSAFPLGIDAQAYQYQKEEALPLQTTPPPAVQDYIPCRRCGGDFWHIDTGGVPLCQACLDATRVVQTTPDSPEEDPAVDVTPQGGKHSAIGAAFHHLDPELMLSLARVLYTGGAKYGRDNWKNISVEDHLNHAFNHVYLFQTERNTEDLEHAILRLMFAWTVENEGGTYAAAN